LTQNSPKGLYYLVLASSPLTNPSKERAIPLPDFHGSFVTSVDKICTDYSWSTLEGL